MAGYYCIIWIEVNKPGENYPRPIIIIFIHNYNFMLLSLLVLFRSISDNLGKKEPALAARTGGQQERDHALSRE